MKIFKAIYKSAMLIASFGVVLFIRSENVKAYPVPMQTTYSGTVKPVNRDLSSYTGFCVTDDYSTCYLGAYVNSASYDTRVNDDEGGGSHTGVDIRGSCNLTVIRSIGEGIVTQVYGNWRSTYPERNACGSNSDGTFGNYVVVRYDDIPNREGYKGKIFVTYAHLYDVNSDITINSKVLRGTVLGTMGSTGNSSGPHVHFQIDKDTTPNHPYLPPCDPSVPTGAPNYYNCFLIQLPISPL